MHSIDIGVITSFSGGLGNIPPGWHLCDGSNGTPDLRDQFVPGAGSYFSVGDEGGNVAHDHSFTSGGHGHDLLDGAELSTPPEYYNEFSSVPITGTTDQGSTLPPYYALAFIMFTGD